jgi:UDP-glucose 4-epimerase
MPHELGGATALVTGAAGFVGANLTRALLEAGCSVEGVVRPGGDESRLPAIDDRLSLHRVDVCDKDALGAALTGSRPDVIFNLARRRADATDAEARECRAVNLGALRSLLGLASERWPGVVVVQLGTFLEHRPASPYALAKADATRLCLEAGRQGGLRSTVLRPVSLFGPHDDPARLIPAAILAAREGRELPLTPPGVKREWLYVGDLVDAALLAADGRAAGASVDLATGDPRDNREVAEIAARAAGGVLRASESPARPRPWDEGAPAASLAPARKLLGWSPATPLERGIARTASWLSERPEAPVAG